MSMPHHQQKDGNSGLELLVVQPLAGVELRPARRELDHDGGVPLASGLQAGVDARGRDAVDGGNGEALLLGA